MQESENQASSANMPQTSATMPTMYEQQQQAQQTYNVYNASGSTYPTMPQQQVYPFVAIKKPPIPRRILNWCKMNKGVTVFYIILLCIVISLPVTIPLLAQQAAVVFCGDASRDLNTRVAQYKRSDVTADQDYIPFLVSHAEYVDSAIDEKEQMEKDSYGILPKYIDDYIYSHGWRIKFVDGEVDPSIIGSLNNLVNTIKEGGGDFYAVGLTQPLTKLITIEATSDYLPSSTIIHEIGHAVDMQSGWISHQSDFIESLESVEPKSETYYCMMERVDIEEKFADLFAYYFMKPKSMEADAPALFDWFMYKFGPAPRYDSLPEKKIINVFDAISQNDGINASTVASRFEKDEFLTSDFVPSLVTRSTVAFSPEWNDKLALLRDECIGRIAGKIQPSVDYLLSSCGWNVIFDYMDVSNAKTGDKLDDDLYHRAAANVDTNTKTIRIYINMDELNTTLDTEHHLIYAIARALDYELGYPSITASFENALAEGDTFANATPDITKEESIQKLFAVKMVTYWQDPKGCLRYDEELYDWFLDITGGTRVVLEP